jgi:hypothetical protein
MRRTSQGLFPACSELPLGSCMLLAALLNCIVRPDVQRIHTLNLRPDVTACCLPEFEPKCDPKPRNAIVKFLRKFLASPGTHCRITHRFAQPTSDLVSMMSNVVELNIEEFWDDSKGLLAHAQYRGGPSRVRIYSIRLRSCME